MDTAIRIDFIPAGVALLLPYTLEPPGLVHLIQACPTKEIRHDVVLPRLIREVPASLNPKGKGFMGLSPLALWVVVRRVDPVPQHDPTMPQ